MQGMKDLQKMIEVIFQQRHIILYSILEKK